MRTLDLNGMEIKIYDDIDELPIINFQKYNKYIMLDAGLGSDVDSIDRHIVNIAKLINANDKKKAMQELQNMRQNMYLIVNELSPKYMAFASLIHSIDGQVVTDLSDSNLKSIIERIRTVKNYKIIDLLMWLKKKLYSELEQYFPEDFGTSAIEKATYDKIKQRTIFILKGISEDDDTKYADDIHKIDEELFSNYKPGNFDGENSLEIKYDKQFESACAIISQKLNMNAKKMSTLSFYNALSVVQKQAEAEAKAYKSIKRR